jgi:1-acyl-sn-glycerol-3-phosphate acyltransferase
MTPTTLVPPTAVSPAPPSPRPDDRGDPRIAAPDGLPGTATDPFDPEACRRFLDDYFADISDNWFRPVLFGGERLPAEGPAILAANHSGTAFPYDAIVLDAFLWRRDGMRPERKIRTTFEHGLALKWWMRPFGIANFWRRGGGVDMLFDNFDRLLARGDRVLYFPEGVPGIAKGFLRRYQLQRFSTSFVLLALRHRLPVVPIYAINAEWVDPLGVPLRWLDRVMQKVFGVPFLPLPIGLLGIIFPWFWYLSFPARMVFVVGEPIDVAAIARDVGIADPDRPTRPQLNDAAGQVRQRMQRELTQHANTHGGRPYDVRSLVQRLWASRRRLHRIIPTGWPIVFLRAERDRGRGPARSRLHAFLRDADLIAYYLPFGWPLLTLARRLRRPPYGWRGVPAEQRRASEGEYTWRLSEWPLPPRA